MSTLDFVFLILLSVGFVMGIMKGAVMQITTLAGLVLGIYAAYLFYKPVAAFFVNPLHFSPKIAVPAAYFVLFVGVGGILYIVGGLLSKVVKVVLLTWLDRLAGGVLGVFKTALVLGILLNLYTSLHGKIAGKEENRTSHSLLYNGLQMLPNKVLPFVDFRTWQHPNDAKSYANDTTHPI
jgi:membrane protein required for colicin V production